MKYVLILIALNSNLAIPVQNLELCQKAQEKVKYVGKDEIIDTICVEISR